jgi:serine/threonine protein kinase
MPPETIVGRYRVVREIGRGGMGSVWLCRDDRLGREVAVKQLGGLPGESSPHVARALREARSSAALNHPHVVAIFDAVEDGERVWLVMEHLPSRNLSQLIEEAGSLRPERLAAIGAQVADGLAAAHARGTVHRDVKPGNILVTDGDLAKISDFGIARTLGDEQITQTGMVMGTPLYFSPQLARGADPVPADDVWALGATLFSAVEGEPPWPHRTNAIAMLTHIATEPPPRPRRAGPLTGVITRMMDPEPHARPTMQEVADDLRAVAAGRYDEPAPTRTVPITVPTPAPIPAPQPATAAPSRRRRPLAVLAVVLAAVVVGAIALLAGPLSDDDTGGGSSARPDRESSGRAATSDAPAPDPTPEETAAEEPPETASEEPATDGAPADLVTDYYASLPSDPETAWAQLAPSYQEEIGRDTYFGFWETIDSVSVDATEPVGDGQVDVTLTYDGAEQEVRRISVADGLIVADEVVG